MKLASLPVVLAAVLGAAQGEAFAETVHGSYVHANPDRVDIRASANPSSNIIYLNGCFGTGCDITPGNESSIDNTSSIIDGTRHLPPFSGGQMEWDAIVDCVRETYQPFDVVITDEDPGDVPHFEAMVAGEASDIGMIGLIGGIAPFMCGETINNAITFTFPELVENDVVETCWVVAQETAHAFGLDHEYLCEDPMSYLRSCDYSKRFVDQDAPCGEYDPRDCYCGGATQNSYRYLLEQFGPGIPTPPSVSIDSPREGEDVEAGFIVRAQASDDLQVDRVELRVNSVFVGTVESEPYVFNVPDTLSEGRLRVEVTAYDNYDYQTTEVVTVLLGAPCGGNSDCAALEACVDGRCVPGPDAEGGLGQRCGGGEDCASTRCGSDGSTRVCTEVCDGTGSCPDGFGCLDSDEGEVCWPGYDDDGGCSTGGDAAGRLILWLVAFALVLRRRRHLVG